MKSFLTILILSSAIFALIEETPATDLASESRKTDLIINTDNGQSIKVNTDQLKGLARGRHSRKARLTHGKNRKADDDSSSIEFDVTFFEPEDFPTELQSDVETLQDAMLDLENACKVESGDYCIGRSTAKTIKSALDDYQNIFAEQNKELLEDLIEEYQEILEEKSSDDSRKTRQLKAKKSHKHSHRKHWAVGFKARLIVN